MEATKLQLINSRTPPGPKAARMLPVKAQDSASTVPTIAVLPMAQLIGAWDKLEERKRILKGAPLPGSLKPESPKAKKAQPLTYTPEGLDK